MDVYKISELLESLKSAQNDGYEYVSVSVLPAEEDMPESIDLEYVENYNTSETDSLDSVPLPDDYNAKLKYYL